MICKISNFNTNMNRKPFGANFLYWLDFTSMHYGFQNGCFWTFLSKKYFSLVGNSNTFSTKLSKAAIVFHKKFFQLSTIKIIMMSQYFWKIQVHYYLDDSTGSTWSRDLLKTMIYANFDSRIMKINSKLSKNVVLSSITSGWQNGKTLKSLVKTKVN